MVQGLQLTAYQRKILSIPEECNLLLCGGRGGGKTVALMALMLRHAEQYGSLARVLLVRETYDALVQIEEEFEGLCIDAYGKGKFSHNKTEGSFKLPNGAMIWLGQLAEQKHYKKYQGKSFSMLIVDEYGAITNTKWIKLLISNVRGAPGVKKRTIYAANPGGAQHGHLHKGHISKAAAWAPYEIDGFTWVNCPSTWRDNPTIDQAAYLKGLKVSCGNDEALFKAWDTGDWNIARGAYFANALDERHPADGGVHMLSKERWPIQKLSSLWQPYIAMDWGSGAPCVSYICAESPGTQGFPKGSLILCDELAVYDPSDEGFNTGLRWPPSKLAEALQDKCAQWGCPTEGVGDDAYGLEETLLQKLGDYGIHLIKPKKERIAGWQQMCNMLTSVIDRTGAPGLYISERCKYFWETVPYLQRDEDRLEDIITTGPDHGADACRYACLHLGRIAWSGGLVGDY